MTNGGGKPDAGPEDVPAISHVEVTSVEVVTVDVVAADGAAANQQQTVSLSPGSCGWAYAFNDTHPVIVLRIQPDGRLFVLVGTSKDCHRATRGQPIAIPGAQAKLLGWKVPTYFYKTGSVTTVESLKIDCGTKCPPMLFMTLRRHIGV